MADLLLGAGRNRERKLSPDGKPWTDLVTLDFNLDHSPDVIWDLSNIPLPFEDNSFDSVSAFDVMEHIGQQGDWRFFFAQWSDIWRILKPGGHFCGISPHWTSPWSWGDPGHTRIVGPECLIFLSQPSYAQVGQTAMTDYRFVYKADFDVTHAEVKQGSFSYILRAVKPSRIGLTGQGAKDWLATIPDPIEP